MPPGRPSIASPRSNAILSDYDPESELSRLSQSAGGAAGCASAPTSSTCSSAPGEMYERSGGAFDVTIAPGRPALAAGPPRPQAARPARLAEARPLVGSDKMVLDPDGADRPAHEAGHEARRRRDRQGLRRAGGPRRAQGRQESRAPWSAGPATSSSATRPPTPRLDDRHRAARARPAAARTACLLLANAAVSTAGDAERFVIIDGHRYSHIINPATGLGVEDRASVTVVAPDGATADALETTVYLLGPERGLKLVDDTPGAAAIFVRSTPEGIKTFESSRFKQVPLAPID